MRRARLTGLTIGWILDFPIDDYTYDDLNSPNRHSGKRNNTDGQSDNAHNQEEPSPAFETIFAILYEKGKREKRCHNASQGICNVEQTQPPAHILACVEA